MAEKTLKTPLIKKLGIKEGFQLLFHHQPENYDDVVGPMPENTSQLTSFESESADFIHLFYVHFSDLEATIKDYISALKKTGMLWVSWPKGSSSIETDLKRDVIRNYVLSLGLVDTKVASFDDDWSALKFVYRLKDR